MYMYSHVHWVVIEYMLHEDGMSDHESSRIQDRGRCDNLVSPLGYLGPAPSHSFTGIGSLLGGCGGCAPLCITNNEKESVHTLYCLYM